jgi:hypothetical protein
MSYALSRHSSMAMLPRRAGAAVRAPRTAGAGWGEQSGPVFTPGCAPYTSLHPRVSSGPLSALHIAGMRMEAPGESLDGAGKF